MRTVDEILSELRTDNARRVRIISGHSLSGPKNTEDAIENARETAGDLAATTEGPETPHAMRRGNTVAIGLHEAQALAVAGATDEVGLDALSQFPMSRTPPA
jgi:hypothetical protein